jgi:D-lactate dehydrogenase
MLKTKASAAAGVAARLKDVILPNRIMTDPLMTYAYSADASAYRLIPAVVVIVNSEGDVRAVLEAARAEGLPVTFRAAGTSLSGQAMTEGVLVVLGDGWKKLQIHGSGERVTLGPGNILANVNRALKRFNRKLGPDPASQSACKIGGVVSNNSSGMCCGVAYNTYHTMDRLRIMLVDGTVLDTGDRESVERFHISHRSLLDALLELRREVIEDADLVALIRKKYSIKNTVGYSINSLVDFDDPVEILTHLMVGSEGTLGFISEVSYMTIEDHPFKATDLVVFPDPQSCARAISKLANGGVQSTTGVIAAEYMERRALASVEHVPIIASYVPLFTETSPAVLIDVAAPDAGALRSEVEKVVAVLEAEGATHVDFSTDPAKSDALWDVRKGFFASAGAARAPGTTLLTEDVAAPIDRLAEFIADLRSLLDDHGYPDATILGHALSGNLHFLMADNFNAPGAAARFDAFSRALSDLVSLRYEGSLKAEHGTGRAIAPFVEAEWGSKAYQIMQRVKAVFDPEGLLNPGVLITPLPETHISNFKTMSLSDPIIDLCVECGLCEPACPSTQMTLSPRQRIAVTRERARLRATGVERDRLSTMEREFAYAGRATCAAGNVCSLRCPIGIETGTLMLNERTENRSSWERRMAKWAARHTRAIEKTIALALNVQVLSRKMIGDAATDRFAALTRKAAAGRAPRVSRALGPGPGPPTGTARGLLPGMSNPDVRSAGGEIRTPAHHGSDARPSGSRRFRSDCSRAFERQMLRSAVSI